MSDRAKAYPARLPPFPLRPGRRGFSRRTRLVLLLFLLAAFVAAAVVGALLARSPAAPHVVTIPAADRAASPALLHAAEALDFRPPQLAGVGRMENEPAAAARLDASGLLPVGQTAPRFALRTPVGKTISLRDLRGKAVLLEFFAAWCPHCAAEAPHLRSLYGRLPHAKVAFVSVDGSSEDAPTVFAYHVWFGLPFPALLDPGSSTVSFPRHGPLGPVSSRYGVGSFPTFYVLDPHGRVVWRSSGEQPDALLARELHHAMSA